jgi:HlyD family type I secretion membrane fusion protein
MSQVIQFKSRSASVPTHVVPMPTFDDSMSAVALRGWLIVIVFFGLFGSWALIAPLNGAVVANGFVKVEGNRKSIQHLDGGIVKELRVREGSKVSRGDTLVVLDDGQARAEFDVLNQLYAVLKMTEARLKVELAGGGQLEYPRDLDDRRNDREIISLWEGQQRQFEVRKQALEGQYNIIKEKIAQLQAQIAGGEAQLKGLSAQLESIGKENVTLAPLLERGLVTRPRILQLERTAAGLEGQIGEINGNIARSRQSIAEQMEQATQVGHQRSTEVAQELRDVQAKLVETVPKLANARAMLERMIIRAPYGGQVVGLTIFSVGGVVGRGDKIMDIVPDRQSLVIEAQVGVDDISDVHPDLRAEVHLTAYKQRTTPIIHGDVIDVSADRLTDNRSGSPYYTALIRVDESELAALPHVRLYPGMPATVMIPTIERTALQYLMGPLSQAFNRALREK